MIRWKFFLLAVAACAAASMALAPTPTLANLLADPGFESGTPVVGGIGGWDVFNGAAFSMAQAHSGDWSIDLTASNSVPGAYQVLPASPGQVYTLTGWALAPVALANGTAFGGIQISYFDGGGTDLGTVETGPGVAASDFRGVGQASGNFVAGVWEPLSVTATAPAGTATLQAFPILIDFGALTEGIFVDDMSVTLVPEPSSIALLLVGMACWAGLTRRRERRAG